MNATTYAAPPRSFFQAIKVCFSKYFNFRGRASRSEYWWFALFCVSPIGVFYGIILIIAVIAPNTSVQTLLDNFISFTYLFTVVSLLPAIMVTVRRLHDTGRSGWWILLLLLNSVLIENKNSDFWMINLLGGALLVWFIVLMCLPGKEKENKYNRLERAAHEEVE